MGGEGGIFSGLLLKSVQGEFSYSFITYETEDTSCMEIPKWFQESHGFLCSSVIRPFVCCVPTCLDKHCTFIELFIVFFSLSFCKVYLWIRANALTRFNFPLMSNEHQKKSGYPILLLLLWKNKKLLKYYNIVESRVFNSFNQ